MSNCIICQSETYTLVDPQLKIEYSKCKTCHFTYKKREYHISLEKEKSEYDQHNNSFESIGYVQMFERFINEFINPLKITKKVLEYGSGPGPVLKELLRRIGHDIYDYDPFFNPNEEYKNHTYELITSTEVFEHFVDPIKELTHLVSLLEPKGYLVIMTSLNTFTDEQFLNWWYRRDRTHISFYHTATFEYISAIFDLDIINTNHKNVIVLQKK